MKQNKNRLINSSHLAEMGLCIWLDLNSRVGFLEISQEKKEKKKRPLCFQTKPK